MLVVSIFFKVIKMKIKQLFLSGLLACCMATSITANAAVTNWNWGGYVAIADSPVIGGFATSELTSTCANMAICTPYRYWGVKAFGMIAYTGSLSGGAWYNGSYTQYQTGYTYASYTCPANTAPIPVSAPYLRSDGISFNPFVNYNPYGGGATPTMVTLCVKTDTY